MFRKAAFVALSAALLSAGACAPMTSYRGFQAIETSPTDIQAGTDTKTTVRTKLGSPSSTSTFNPNVWYYIAEVKERVAFLRPRVTQREITAISFDADTEAVERVDVVTLEEGKVIAFNGRETPTRGRELTILEQLLGTVGRGSMLPRDDESAPGNRPGDRR
jgi:outer membrane protein assembly factor BamE (lipoprotein component of BamABCDE complex)